MQTNYQTCYKTEMNNISRICNFWCLCSKGFVNGYAMGQTVLATFLKTFIAVCKWMRTPLKGFSTSRYTYRHNTKLTGIILLRIFKFYYFYQDYKHLIVEYKQVVFCRFRYNVILQKNIARYLWSSSSLLRLWI